MADDKKGWLYSDVYTRAASAQNRLPRTSLFKFGTFKDVIDGAIRLLAQWMIAGFLFAFLLILLFDSIERHDDQSFLILGEVIRAICVTISVFLSSKIFSDIEITDLGLKFQRQAVKDFLAGFAFVGCIVMFLFVVFRGLGWLTIENTVWQTYSFQSIILSTLLMLIVFILVGWSEELLSRGFHLRLISKGLNRPLGIILSAFIFSYLHRDNLDITLGGLVFIFLFGIILAFAFLRTGQLWLAIGLHAGWDFFVVVFWGTPISDLNIFHFMEINFRFFPLPGFILEFFELCVIAVFIYFYTSRRQAKFEDW